MVLTCFFFQFKHKKHMYQYLDLNCLSYFPFSFDITTLQQDCVPKQQNIVFIFVYFIMLVQYKDFW